ncbi:hypothetical protein ES703_61249 [subsurface metagenome]
MTEAILSQVNNVGVNLLDLTVADIPALHHSRPKVVFNDVGLGGKLSKHFLPFGFMQVQPQPVFIGVHMHKRRSLLLEQIAKGSQVAAGITHRGELALDDFGAHLGQKTRSGRAQKQGTYLKYSDAF